MENDSEDDLTEMTLLTEFTQWISKKGQPNTVFWKDYLDKMWGLALNKTNQFMIFSENIDTVLSYV